MIRLLCFLLPLAAHATPVPYREVYSYLVGQEGYRLHPYRDGEGFTVGVGHSLTAHAEDVRPYSRVEIQMMFDRDLTNARRAARGAIQGFDDLPHSVQLACLSLCWCVGPTGFYRFHAFRRHLSARDYPSAVRALQRSIWAGQIPARAANTIELIQNGG